MKETDVFECLETGAQELGTLLGYGPNTEELTCDQIVQRWLSKTTGAGLTQEDAATFLAHRLAEELWELQEVHLLPVADSMSRILASFSNLKRTNGFFAGFNSITLSSALAEAPDGVPYAVLHSQDIGDLEAHGSCHVAFGSTTEDGGSVPYRQRVLVGEAPCGSPRRPGAECRVGRRPSSTSLRWRGSGGRRMRPKRFSTAEEISLALQWEEVRAEYLANNQRPVEADLVRAKAQSFRNQLQEDFGG